jgi:hypothetical protein
LTYILNIYVLSYQPPTGSVQVTGLTLPDLVRMAMEASSVWEQVGVQFDIGFLGFLPATTNIDLWDLPGDWPWQLTAVTNSPPVRYHGLDVFIVNSVFAEQRGREKIYASSTACRYMAFVDPRETGVVLARRKSSPTSPLEEISALARTMAHEIGHLIFNSGSHQKRPKTWNLMRKGDANSSFNADLTLAGDLGSRYNIKILPGGIDGYNFDESW